SGILTLKVSDNYVATANIGVGLTFGTVPVTAYFGSDASGVNQYDCNFNSFTALAPSANSSVPYYKFGSNSIKLINSGYEDELAVNLNLGTTASYMLSAYVYDGTTGNIGGTMSSSIAQLSVGATGIGTTYTDQGGGWWRLNGVVTGAGETRSFGIQVKSGKTVYVDGMQLERKSFPTTYADGSLGNGYSWNGTENTSASERALGNLIYGAAGNFNEDRGTVSFWIKLTHPPGKTNGNLFSLNNNALRLVKHTNSNGIIYFDQPENAEGNDSDSYVISSWATGQWYAITATWDVDAALKKLYVNGEEVISNSTYYNITASPTSLLLGYSSYGSANSVISNFKIYNTALTQRQISDLYWGGLINQQDGSEEMARYNSSGTYISPVMDLSANGLWGTSAFVTSATAPEGSSIQYFTRTSADNLAWGNWAQAVGTSIASDPRRYLQWKALLASNSIQSETPVVSGITLTYVEDSDPPTNPSAAGVIGYSTSVGTTVLTTNNWYNYATPSFVWEIGVDTEVEGRSASGVAGYYVLLTSEVGATPTENSADDCYAYVASGTSSRVGSGGWSECSLADGLTYYLRLQTKDNSGNISAAGTMFTYKYDGVLPSAPVSVSVNPRSYTSINNFTVYWMAASDVGNTTSGFLGYKYKTGAGGTSPFANDQFTAGTQLTAVEAYQDGVNTFYIKGIDNAGNESDYTQLSYYYNGSAPSAPRNLAVGISYNTANSFSFSWDEPESYKGSISEYRYSVNTVPSATNYTAVITNSLSSGPYATVKGKNVLYLVAVDEAGNVNYDAYASVDFTADTSAPGIPRNLETFDNSIRATKQYKVGLTWDPPSNLGTGFAGYAVYISSTLASCETDFSKFSLAGTTGGTTCVVADIGGTALSSQMYYLCVKAYDSTNQYSVVSSTVSLTPTGKWLVAPDLTTAPSSTVKTKSATISWSTSREANSFVKYGASSGNYGNEVGSSDQVTAHSIGLSNLNPGTKYYYKVLWTDEDGNQGSSVEYSFTTNSAPSVAEVRITDIGLYTAYVNVTLRNTSKATVKYGKTTAYGMTESLATSTSESDYTVKLEDLDEGEEYHLQIAAEDEESNVFNSDDYVFETLPMPKVENIKIQQVKGMSTATIRIAWDSNTGISSIVSYYPVGRPEMIKDQVELTLSKLHEMVVKDLDDNTDYIILVKGKDMAGNSSRAEEKRFKTSEDMRPPTIQNLEVEATVTGAGEETTAQITVYWDTDEPATAQIEFGEGTGSEYANRSQEDKALNTNHTVTIPDLRPNQVYHLRVMARDRVGNEANSYDNVIITPKSTRSAMDIVVDNLSKSFRFFTSLNEMVK
ncbi:MAG: fibronectin type III domain-containing protein, partial [Candidatus Shapirobacteria bacterium]